MAVNTGIIVANGIISAIVLACGIIMSILIDQVFKKIVATASWISYISHNSYGDTSYDELHFWAFGFAEMGRLLFSNSGTTRMFIIPGVIGVSASLARHKWGFIIQMVCAITTLIVKGIVFIVALLYLYAFSVYGYTNCHDAFGTCVCSNRHTVNVQSGCSDMNAISSMAIGATAMVVIGLIGCLAASITGGMLACARKTTPGVVMHQTHQPGFTMVQMSNTPGAAQPYVIQPGY